MKSSLYTFISYKTLARDNQKQPSRGALKKRCSENTQQMYSKTPMPKCDFNSFATFMKSHFGMGVLL